MESPLAGARSLIYFAFLAAAVQECEAVRAPAGLSDLRAGLLWVSIILVVFSLVSTGTGFILAPFLVGAGQICRNEFVFSFTTARRCSRGINEATRAVNRPNKNSTTIQIQPHLCGWSLLLCSPIIWTISFRLQKCCANINLLLCHTDDTALVTYLNFSF